MLIAFNYDHRIIDARESAFGKSKGIAENPDQVLYGKDPVKTLLKL